MITVEAVTKRFKPGTAHGTGAAKSEDHIAAVDNVSFACTPGRVFSLLGPNGAGKTTMLRMIATMLRPSSGRITVAGCDTVKEQEGVRGRIGFLTGTTGLYARLTPHEIVSYYGELHGVEKGTLEKRREELFFTLGIEGFANRRTGSLSSGMKQKVSIARTMIHDPEVLVFDEPTVGLDVVTSKSIMTLIRGCRDQGKTVVFSTHIMGEVSLLSDDLAIIHRGRLLFCDTFGRFTEGMRSKTIEDEFIGMIEAAEARA
jgi:sodium transport system ATP-binding protein